MREAHCRSRTTRCDGTEGCHIAEHFGQRSLSLDDTGAGTAGFHAFYLATTLVKVGDNVAHGFLGGYDLYLHDRFEEDRAGLFASLLEGLDGTEFERKLVGVDRVERTVENSNLEVFYGEAGEDAVLHSRSEALLDGGDKLLGDVAALDFVDKFEVAFETFVDGLYAYDDVCELTTAACLLLEYFAELDGTCDSFLVCNLGTALVALYLEFAAKTVDDDIEVELTHTGDNGLAGLLVSLHAECRVFFGELLEAYAEFVEVLLGLGFYGDTDHGFGEFHSFENDRSVFVAEGVACADILEAYACTDITAADDILGVLLVGVHLEEAANAFLLAGTCVEHVGSCVHVAGVNAEEAETAHIGVCSDLECESAEGLVAGGMACDDFVGVVDSAAFDSACVGGAGEVCADSVEEALHALVLKGGTADHRNEVHAEGCLAESSLDFCNSDCGRIVEVLGHEVVVVFGDFFEHFVAPLLGLFDEACGDFVDFIVGAHGLVMPEDSLHGDEVDHTLECLFSTDRNLDGARVGTEHVLELAYYFEEVCARTVHLVDITDTGHVVFVGLTPYGLALGFYTAHSTESGNGTVEHAERTLHFDCEVDVSRGVDQVDLIFIVVIFPECGGSGRGDCDASFLLLFHPVHGSGTIVNLADLVCQTGIEEDTLGSSCLAGVDVGHNADIAGKFEEFVRFCHFEVFLRNFISVRTGLETEVGESTVGFGHLVHIFFAFESAALQVEGIDDLSSQLVGHRLAATLAGIEDQVLHRYRFLTVSADFSRNLECGTTDTAALHFDLGCNVFQGFFPDIEGAELLVGEFGLHSLERVVEYCKSCVLLTIVHQMIHELGDAHVVENRIREDHMFLGLCLSHFRAWRCCFWIAWLLVSSFFSAGLCRVAYSTCVSCKKCKNEFKKCLFNLGCVQIASPVCGADGLLLGCTGLGTLGSVFGATLCAVLDTCGIESAADDVVTYTGKVLYTAATNEDDGVLL